MYIQCEKLQQCEQIPAGATVLMITLKSQGNLGCGTEQQDVLEKTPGPKGSEVPEDAQVLIAFLRHMLE